jgi:hypothetical protein
MKSEVNDERKGDVKRGRRGRIKGKDTLFYKERDCFLMKVQNLLQYSLHEVSNVTSGVSIRRRFSATAI